MITRTPSTRLLVAIGVLALGLTACGGTETPDAEGSPAVSDQLPTDDGDGASSSCLAGDEDCIDESNGGDAPMDGMCIEGEEDCTDTGVLDDDSSSSCLAGDEDCTDESNGSGDVTRPIDVVAGPLQGTAITEGSSSGASGKVITAATVDGTSLTLQWDGGDCDVLEDVLVVESETEVRVMVLAGMDAGVDACTQSITTWTTTVTLDAELGDRVLLDLAG